MISIGRYAKRNSIAISSRLGASASSREKEREYLKRLPSNDVNSRYRSMIHFIPSPALLH